MFDTACLASDPKKFKVLPIGNHPWSLHEGCVSGCLKPNQKSDTGWSTPSQTKTTYVLKTNKDTCTRCTENTQESNMWPETSASSMHIEQNAKCICIDEQIWSANSSDKTKPNTCVQLSDKPHQTKRSFLCKQLDAWVIVVSHVHMIVPF